MIAKKRKEFKIPDYSLPCPSLNDFQNRQYFYREDGAVFLRGIGNASAANVMFIASCPLEEDADEDYSYSDPCLLKAESTAAFKRLCLRAGINLDLEYFTNQIINAKKWCLGLKHKVSVNKDRTILTIEIEEELE